MVVNTESVVGYNNKLKKATSFMQIGINSDLKIPVRRSAPKHNFGPGAVKLLHSGVETQNKAKQATATAKPERQRSWRRSRSKARRKPSSEPEKQAETKETRVVKSEKSEKSETSEAKTVPTSHENNLNVLIIIAGGLAWFLFR